MRIVAPKIARDASGIAGPARNTSTLGAARKVLVAALGGTVLAIGVALIVLPGPAVLVIPAGLAILATEFPWARRLFRFAKERISRLLARRRGAVGRAGARRRRTRPPPDSAS